MYIELFIKYMFNTARCGYFCLYSINLVNSVLVKCFINYFISYFYQFYNKYYVAISNHKHVLILLHLGTINPNITVQRIIITVINSSHPHLLCL